MNFSGYFLLIATAGLVVVAQQSEAGAILDKIADFIEDGINAIENKLDPGNKKFRDTIALIKERAQENIDDSIYVNVTIKLRNDLINSTIELAKARSTILDGISAAREIISENPEAARNLTQQAWENGKMIGFDAGVSYLKAIGEVLGLSNYGAMKGLLSASIYIQKGGFVFLDMIEPGESLFDEGSKAGGSAAKVLLKAYKEFVEAAFSGVLYNAQKSVDASFGALRDAQSKPMQGQIGNARCGAAAKDDSEGSDALKHFNNSSKNALENGANPALVQQFKEAIECSLDALVKITLKAKRDVANIKTIAGIDPYAASISFLKQAEAVKKGIHELAAKVYLAIGDVYVKSGMQSDNEVKTAILVLEIGKVEIFEAIKLASQIVVVAVNNGDDTSKLAIDAAAESGLYGKLALIQSMVQCADIVFSIL